MSIKWVEGQYGTYRGYVGKYKLFSLYYTIQSRGNHDANKNYTLRFTINDSQFFGRTMEELKEKAEILLKQFITEVSQCLKQE